MPTQVVEAAPGIGPNGPASPPVGLRRALRTTPPGLSPLWRRTLVAVILVQLVAIAVVSSIVAAQFKVWSPLDEEAHYSYVQQIAEHGTLPVLGKTETSLQGLAIGQGIYPHRTTIDPKTDGLGGLNYEAFQPPLYYIVAVPAFDLTSNYLDKVYALRGFDLVLLMASIALAGRLARLVLKDRWMIGWSMTLVFFLLPGVVVRFATISDLALAVPLAILFISELWVAWERHSTRRLVVAGAIGGLCVLTYLELVVLLPVFALVVVAEAWRRWQDGRWRDHLWWLVAACVVPIVLMAPWFISNELHYHLLTAGSIAIKEQTSIINPDHVHYTLSELPGQTVQLIFDVVLPQEWWSALAGRSLMTYLFEILTVLMIPFSLLMVASRGRRLWSVRQGILVLPWAIEVLEMWYIRYGEQWNIAPRYTYPTLPVLLIAASSASWTAFRNRAVLVMIVGGATAMLAVLWIFLIGGYTGPYALT